MAIGYDITGQLMSALHLLGMVSIDKWGAVWLRDQAKARD